MICSIPISRRRFWLLLAPILFLLSCDKEVPRSTAPYGQIQASVVRGTRPLSVSFQALVEGGEAPLSYRWDFKDGSSTKKNPTHVFETPGFFTVVLEVTDSRGQTARDSLVITVVTDAALDVQVAADGESGLAPFRVNFTGALTEGQEPHVHLWDFGDGTGSTLRSTSHTYTLPGLYTVTLRITDDDGRSGTGRRDILVAEDDKPAVYIGAGPGAGLAPLSVQFRSTAVGGNSPLEYRWNFGDGTPLAQLPEPEHIYLNAGTYTATLTVTDGDGDSASDALEVMVADDHQPAVAARATPNPGQLKGIPASLTVQFEAQVTGGDSPFTFAWEFTGDHSIDETLQNPSHTYFSAGTYPVTVKVTDADGDTTTGEFALEILSNPIPSVTTRADRREGTAPLTVQFTAEATSGNPPLRYLWDFGDGASSINKDPLYTYRHEGTYLASLLVTDVDGDRAMASLSITVAQDHLPEAYITLSPASGTAPLGVQFRAMVLGGDPPLTYNWDFGDGASCPSAAEADGGLLDGGAVQSCLEPAHQYQRAGEYTALFSVTDADGDRASATATVKVGDDHQPVASASAEPTRGVAPLSVQLRATVSGGNSPYYYHWKEGAVTLSRSQNPVLTFQSGAHQVTLTVEDGDGDTAGETVVVMAEADSVPSVTAVTATPPTGIAPLLLKFDAEVAHNGSPNEPVHYHWEFGDGTYSTQISPTHTYPLPGTYSALLTVTDSDGDHASAAAMVTVLEDLKPAASALISPAAGCAIPQDASAAPTLSYVARFTCQGSGGNEPLAYSWDFGDQASCLSQGENPAQCRQADHTYLFPQPYNLPLTLRATCSVRDSDRDAASATEELSITNGLYPQVSILADPVVQKENEPVRFTSQVTCGYGAYSYLWDFGDGVQASTANPTHRYANLPDGGFYQARLTVTDQAGRTGTATQSIKVVYSQPDPAITSSAYRLFGEGSAQRARFSITVENLGGSDYIPAGGDAIGLWRNATNCPPPGAPPFDAERPLTAALSPGETLAVTLELGDYADFKVYPACIQLKVTDERWENNFHSHKVVRAVLNEVYYQAPVDGGLEHHYVEVYGPAAPEGPLAVLNLRFRECVPANGGKAVRLYSETINGLWESNGPLLVRNLAVGVKPGPASIELYDENWNLLDVLVYGVSSGCEFPFSEGAATGNSQIGESLSRKLDGVDSDRNSDDFQSCAPTRNSANCTP